MAIATETEYDHIISEIKRPQMFTPSTSGRGNDWTPVLMDAAAVGCPPCHYPKLCALCEPILRRGATFELRPAF